MEELLREPEANADKTDLMPILSADFLCLYEGIKNRISQNLGKSCLIVRHERHLCRDCGCLAESISYCLGKPKRLPSFEKGRITLHLEPCRAQDGEGTRWYIKQDPLVLLPTDFPTSYRDELAPMDWESRAKAIRDLEQRLGAPVMCAQFEGERLRCYSTHTVQVLIGPEVNEYFYARSQTHR